MGPTRTSLTRIRSRRRTTLAAVAAAAVTVPVAAAASSAAGAPAASATSAGHAASAARPGNALPEAAAATGPSTTITEPSAGSTAENGRVTIRGRYASTSKVTAVTVVLCRPNSPTTCKDYLLASTNGAFATRWRGILTRLTPDSTAGTTGAWSVTLTGLPTAKLRVAAFATDSTTPKGPSTLLDFAVKAPEDPSFISILWGRANWSAAGGVGCVNRPDNARTLEQNAIDLAALGLPAVAQVVTSRVHETKHLCPDNFALESSWADLARLRASYGWSLTSQSNTYPNLTTLSDAGIIAESTGSLPSFTSRGHDRAWGAFAYPNNKQDARVQKIVLRSFAFGRVYSSEINSRATATTFPYPMRTLSVNGGRCHNAALPCSRMAVTNNRLTTSPHVIAKMLKPGPGKWGVVQFYRIVDGVESTMGMNLAWDCSSPHWEDRWTSQPELYCRETMLQALALRNKSAIAADPAAVALSWGRTPWRTSGR